MHVFEQTVAELDDWIRDEVEYPGRVGQGDIGSDVRRVQEWLNLHGFGLVVDGDFGRVTARMLDRFQQQHGLAPAAVVDELTFDALVQPMTSVLTQRLNHSVDLGTAVLGYAHAHLAAGPREVGGQNRGPWVRLYMRGNEGPAFAWCAGFATFLIEQAAQSLQVDKPIDGSFSCDDLADQADDASLFVREHDASPETVPPGSVFLVRRTATDWTHTGIVVRADDVIDTIEGNTNDAGDREGYEVCARARGYTGKDFIVLDRTAAAWASDASEDSVMARTSTSPY